ncbi:MAG: bifunctional demethylmenaquinone methyltransferase/2-methoxy-6-polyprenyl-1,4-benzoquinol methylase UbiE [Candidatus Pelagibacter sp.]|nr:bifunctional demethylmenaquinone methyltransferase/2-methoxy-6-polyprenyl-1,4-benzoquinol methylase UbiE [Candidatus Pelagibacter sp.]
MVNKENKGSEENTSPFGFSFLKAMEKSAKIKDLFNSVSDKYDLMNDLMSLGAHRFWKSRFINQLPVFPNSMHIDVAGGTGDISILLQKKFNDFSVKSIVLDQSEDMIRMGRIKALDQGISTEIDWKQGQSENLPFEDNYFDLYTISFGLRNVTSREKTLQEALRVLKPGGHFFCLEFSHVQKSLLNLAYSFYRDTVIPYMGELVANDKSSYQYLADSIVTFPQAVDLKNEMMEQGFILCSYESWFEGIVALHKGMKPF